MGGGKLGAEGRAGPSGQGLTGLEQATSGCLWGQRAGWGEPVGGRSVTVRRATLRGSGWAGSSRGAGGVGRQLLRPEGCACLSLGGQAAGGAGGGTPAGPHPPCLPQATGSDTSLEASRSSSAGSLQTTLEDSLTLSDSPRRALGPPVPAPGPRAGLSPATRRLSLRGRGLFSRRGLRAHQRSHSSGGSTSPGCTHHDSMDPSDEEGTGRGAGGGGGGSEHSETLSSLSLTSLFCPPPAPSGLPPARRFSSTSSLAAGPGRPRAPAPLGLARSPSWAADHSKDPRGPAQPPGELQPADTASKRKR